MRRAIVLGAGRSGRAAEALLRAQGVDVLVLEGEDAFPCGDRNVAAPAGVAGSRGDRNVAAPSLGGAGVGAATGMSPQEREFDFVVVSPGIALTHPWVVEAKRCGIPLKSELQLGCETLKRQGWKLLAVTGSKGKSSVVKVVADAINFAGMEAVACGNYGVPVCEVAGGCGDRNVAAPAGGAGGCGDRNVAAPSLEAGDGAVTGMSPQTGWAVVEVSSFMMETTELPGDTFEAAAILNLQEDHLDRHGSVEVYHGLKRKLLAFAKKGFGPAATGMSSPLWSGSYFDNEILAGNAAIAVELMRVAGLDDARIAAAFKAFKPLPHRMNLVAELDGVRYVDDSKATSLAALIAGIRMASATPQTLKPSNPQTILLIAGGLPKGDDPKTALATLTERVKKVYLIGQGAEAFSAAWKGAVDCEICGTMDKAVEKAKREAEKGETVLLSPGTASFDQFQSYGERGEVFVRLVKKEGQPK